MSLLARLASITRCTSCGTITINCCARVTTPDGVNRRLLDRSFNGSTERLQQSSLLGFDDRGPADRHVPLHAADLAGQNKGALHLYGHSHGKLPGTPQSML
jgi:hypothetical protein